jgi:hypothetical protein
VNLEALPVRWLFVTMLSQTNKDHLCYGTVESLAAMANLTLEETKQALCVLTSPDPRSSSKAEEGRRVLPKPGNRWFIVNHEVYVAKNPSQQQKAIKRAKAREKKRRQRARRRGAVPLETGDRGGTSTCNSDNGETYPTLSVPVSVPVPNYKNGDAPSGAPSIQNEATSDNDKTEDSPGKKPQDHGGPQQVIEAFVGAFKGKYGTLPLITKGKDHAIAKQLLDGRSTEDACAIARAFASDPPAGLQAKGMTAFSNVLLAANEIIIRLSKKPGAAPDGWCSRCHSQQHARGNVLCAHCIEADEMALGGKREPSAG